MIDSATRPMRQAIIGAILLSGVVALWLMLELGGGAPQPQLRGLPDPGALTGWSLPVLTYTNQLLGITIVGTLVVPLLTITKNDKQLTRRSFDAVRAVTVLALGWAAVSLALLVFSYSDQFAVPPGRVDLNAVWGFARTIGEGRALLTQIVGALMLALASRFVLSLKESVWLLALALATQLPPAFSGHSASSGSHDAAIISLLFHIGAASAWAGGLVALWWHLGAAAKLREIAARRFSAVAAWAFGVVFVSGFINALIRLGSPLEFITSGYGRGALVKVILLLLLGLIAAQSRRVALGRMRAEGARADLVLLTGIELVAISAAIGLGVALSRTPPPVGEIYNSPAENLLGGPVPPAPSIANFALQWAPSGVGIAIVTLGTIGYALGLRTLRRSGARWPIGRTIAWYAGLALVGYATIGGLGKYANVMFSAHMAAHMMLSMVAPILLVLGAPITLALRTLPGGDKQDNAHGIPGPRHWLSGALRSRYVRFITHPIVAALIFVGSLYAVYFTGIFGALMASHMGHAFMELHFLITGLLFFEVLIGTAPVANRLSHLSRLALLLVVMPFHAFFAIGIMNYARVIGGSYYRLLDAPYVKDLLGDQYLGGSLTWALGEVPMVMVMVVLVFQWFRSDSRDAQRYDRRAARNNDADLTAYNERLAAVAKLDKEAADKSDKHYYRDS